jgi:hypothetical protein
MLKWSVVSGLGGHKSLEQVEISVKVTTSVVGQI